MSTFSVILQVLNGWLFTAWVVMMFITLFGNRRRAVARTGKKFPGPVDTVHEWQHWWRNPEVARQRRLLIGLTLALIGCTALMASLAITSA